MFDKVFNLKQDAMNTQLKDELLKAFADIPIKKNTAIRSYSPTDVIHCVKCGCGIKDKQGIKRNKQWICYYCFNIK
jgi:hypothetical protein